MQFLRDRTSKISTRDEMASDTTNNRVSFNAPDGEERVAPRKEISEEKAKRNKQIVTCKYDRKVMRIRLDIEEWMDEQLRELYECEEDEDYPIEIDIDDLLRLSSDERRQEIESLIKDASQPSQEFTSQLLTKILQLQKSHTMTSPGSATSIDFHI